ncbi:hypothetical protein CDAR_236381 [Caerostris darwini]|uniref:Uncharacterized protein n=1 Tax=Caerostris darwini TaxID=1538125 RepID=A0AAV4T9X1_9ARAC|nr:hypothetical protein CDAR_236381 [Caerostris darwini]
MITCPQDDANSLQPKGSSAGIELPPPNQRMRLLQYGFICRNRITDPNQGMQYGNSVLGNSSCSLRCYGCMNIAGVIPD